MSIRSITPWSSCSRPIGISVATTCWPKACFTESSARKKSARSRSSMFTNRMRASPSSEARSQRRLVVTSAPITPLITNTAPSHTRSAHSASATKLGSPGVSIRLILRSSQRNEEKLAEIDISRAFSSGAESDTVVPSATEPSRLIAPAVNRSASLTEVFPLPRWPTKATLRIRFGDSCAIDLLPSYAGLCRLLRQRRLQGRVDRGHAVHVGEHQHTAQRGRVGHHQTQLVVRHRVEQLLAYVSGVCHVDLAAEARHHGAAVALDPDLRERAHAAREAPSRLLILTTVPSCSVDTSTVSIRPSMMFSPRPRCAPRRSLQCPRSLTVATSSRASRRASTSNVASPGP